MALTRRLAILALALATSAFLCGKAPAAVEMSTGIRYVDETNPPGTCSSKAQAALAKYLQPPSESPAGSGDWVAFGPQGGVGAPTTSAAVRCYPVRKGFVVTFTCVVQTPESPYSANDLCLDVAHNFSGKAETVLATPKPLTGCATTNLVGAWTSDDKAGLTFTMTVDGELTDSDGVSGNWGLYGDQVTLTYYGTHQAKLSPDGKHISGGGYNLTRKC